MKLDSSISLYAGGPGSGRRGDNRTEDQRKAIYQTVTKPLSVKEAQDNEEWHKSLEEMGVPEGILEAEEEQVEMESRPISRKLGKTIKQVGTNFCVIGNAPDVNLGCYNSKEQAETVKRGGSFIEPDIKAGGPGSGRHKYAVGDRVKRNPAIHPKWKAMPLPGTIIEQVIGKNNQNKSVLGYRVMTDEDSKLLKNPKLDKWEKPSERGTFYTEKELVPHKDIKSFADMGEPMAGALGHAHLDSNLWFHPPSLKNADKIPTDDPKEKNDRFLDVTKRNSKDTKKQRMQLLKRSSPGGTVQIPAHTTLIAPHTASYLPGMFGQAVRTKPVLPGRTRLVSKSY